MPFHLVLPGLLWPQKALRDTAHDLSLPNLSWLLGRGQVTWKEPLPMESWLCQALADSPADRPPAAALRLLGEGGKPGSDTWLCADPVHVRIEQGRAHLLGDDLKITDDEMQQLVTALAPHFATVGDYRSGVPGNGYLRLTSLPRMRTTPPSAAAGRGGLLPDGEDAAQWLRLGNESQMVLHALPLNERRETAGLPRLNSLWFWGAGPLPASPVAATGAYQTLIGNHPLLGGLAAWANISHDQFVPHSQAFRPPADRTLLLLDELLTPSQTLDASAWRTALTELDAGWLGTIRALLRSGRLGPLHITALGDEATLEITLNRADALKFWRRPKRLHELRPWVGVPP